MFEQLLWSGFLFVGEDTVPYLWGMGSIIKSIFSSSTPSDLKDPFRQDCIETIRFRIAKSFFAPYDVKYTASVEFKNGGTSGQQDFTADDFNSLVQKVEQFTKNL